MQQRPQLPSRVSDAVQRFSSTAWRHLGTLTAEGASDTGRPGPEPPETDLRTLTVRLGKPALWGTVGSAAIVYGASQYSSPFTLKLAGAWFFGIPPITTPPGGGDLLISLVASWGGMFLLVRAWFEMLRVVSPSRTGRRPVAVAAVAVVAALWLLPTLVGPPLFSQDVYSYAAQGQMVTQGINPYQHGPDVLGTHSSYYPLFDQLWGASPAPYGPVFIEADAAINNLAGHHVLAAVVGLRLLALLGVVLMAVFLPAIARALGREPSTVFTLAILNPVTVLHLVGGAHNDALMLGLLVAGIAMSMRGRPIWAVVLCALAAAVKVPAALGVVYVGWHWLGTRTGWRERVRPLVTSGVIGGGLLAVITAATGLGWGWTRALSNPSVVRSFTDPMTAFGMIGGSITHALHLPIGISGMLTVTRGIGLLAAMGAGAWLLFASDRIGVVKAIGTTLLLVVVLGPVVQPWYLAWGIIVLAPVAFGPWRRLIVSVTVIGSFIGFPGGWALIHELGRAQLWAVAVSVLILLSISAPPIVARVRRLLASRPAPEPASPALAAAD